VECIKPQNDHTRPTPVLLARAERSSPNAA
jgi:hypothetical protein